MKYSTHWLQEHIVKPLPDAEELRRIVTTKAFEVEEMETHGDLPAQAGDAVFDIKVLPDRAHDALSHRGMAREIAALCDLGRKERESVGVSPDPSVPDVRVTVEDPRLCPRYIGVRLDNIAVGPSPEWLSKKLESIGSRSINNIVDITNFILFDLGQPTHAFDAAKVSGGITVRLAKKGEKMMTLDNKDLELDGTELVIADDEAVLALAGVKGGKKAEVDAKTTSIIFEVANFQPTLTRRTSTRHGVKTDASKRYENGIASELAGEALAQALPLFVQYGGAKVTVGRATDVSAPRPRSLYKVGVSLSEMNRLLGSTMTDVDIATILERLGYAYEKVSPRARVLERVRSVVGKPYKRAARILFDSPDAFSCSSLTAWACVEAGIAIPRIVIDQFVYARPITKDEIRPGDLVFTNTGEVVHTEGKYYSQVLEKFVNEEAIRTETLEFMPGTPVPQGMDHVGVYVGDGKVVHASVKQGGVVEEALDKSTSFTKECWYGRVTDNDEERYVVSVPPERLDLRIKEDLIEEIGRHYGYDKIPSGLPTLPRKGVPHKRLYYANKLRNILVKKGFSEVFTYSFVRYGEGEIEVIEVENPVGKDRPFMRWSLEEGIYGALEKNNYNAALIGISDVRIFEIGNVFTKDEEYCSFAMGMYSNNKKRAKQLEEEVRVIQAEIEKVIGVSTVATTSQSHNFTQRGNVVISGLPLAPYIFETNFDEWIAPLPSPSAYEPLQAALSPDMHYRSLSIYPFIVRDIALFVPAAISEEEIEKLIKGEAGELVVRFSRFDKFQKPGEDRVSYAYRLVFQSFDRTLTDDEVNGIMEKVTAALNANEGWEVR